MGNGNLTDNGNGNEEPPSSNKSSNSFKLESFIFRTFAKMPRSVRVGVYLALVLVYIFNVLHVPILEGTLYVTDSAGIESPGAKYRLESPNSGFKTNFEGKWALTAPQRLLPIGGMTVEVLHPTEGNLLGKIDLCPPTPIIGRLMGGFKYYINYNETNGAMAVTPACNVGGVAYAQDIVQPIVNPQQQAHRTRVSISRIELRKTKHRSSTAEVYFRVFHDDKRIQTPQLPWKRKPYTWLLLLDDRPVTPNDLGFVLTDPLPAQIRIEMWDRDEGLFSTKDDKLGEFNLLVQNKGSFELKDEREENPTESTITVEVSKELP